MPLRRSGVVLEVLQLNSYIQGLQQATKANESFAKSGAALNNIKPPNLAGFSTIGQQIGQQIGKGAASANIGGSIQASIGNISSGAGNQGSIFGSIFAGAASVAIGNLLSGAIVGAVNGAISLARGAVDAAISGIQQSIQQGSIFESGISNVASNIAVNQPQLITADNQLDPTTALILKDTLASVALDPNLIVDLEGAGAAAATLTKFGFDAQDLNAGALQAAVLLANATGANNDLAAETLAKYAELNNVAPENLVAAVSQITGTITAGAFRNLNDYRYALVNSAGDLQNFGVAQEDVNALLAAANPAFSSGRTGGTAFAAFVRGLTPTTDKAKEAISELGLSFFDIKGNFKGINPIIADLRKAFAGLTEEQQSAYAETIFGVTGGQFLKTVLRETTDESLAATRATIQNADALRAAALRTDNLKSKLGNLGDALAFLGVGFSGASGEGDSLLNILTEGAIAGQGLAASLLPAATTLGANFTASIRPAADTLLNFIDTLSASINQANALGGNFSFDFGGLKVLNFNDLFAFELGGFQVTLSDKLKTVVLGAVSFVQGEGKTEIKIGDLVSIANDSVAGTLDLQLGTFETTIDVAALQASIDPFLSYIQSIPDRLISAFAFPAATTDNGTSTPGAGFQAPDLSSITTYITELPNQITQAFTGLTLPDVGTLIQDKVAALSEQARLAFGGLVLPDIGQLIRDKIGGFTSPTIDPTGVDQPAAAGFQINLPNIGQLIQDKINAVLPTDFTITLPDLKQKFSDAIAAIIPADFSFDTLFPESASSALTNITSGLSAFAGAIGLADLAIAGATSDTGSLGQIRTFITGTIQGISDSLAGIDTDQAQAAGASFSNVVVSVLGVFTTLSNLGNVNVESLSSTLGTLTKGVLDFATGFVTGIDAEAVAGAASGFIQSYIDEFSIALAAPDIPGIAASAAGFIEAITGKIGEALNSDATTGIADSLGGLVTTLVDTLSATLNNGELSEGLLGSFDNLAKGLAGGLARAFESEKLAKSLGEGAVNLPLAITSFIGKQLTAGLPKFDASGSLGEFLVGDLAKGESPFKVVEGGLLDSFNEFTEGIKAGIGSALVKAVDEAGIYTALSGVTTAFSNFVQSILNSAREIPGVGALIDAVAGTKTFEDANPAALSKITAAGGSAQLTPTEAQGAGQELARAIDSLTTQIANTTDPAARAGLETQRNAAQIAATSLNAQTNGFVNSEGKIEVTLPPGVVDSLIQISKPAPVIPDQPLVLRTPEPTQPFFPTPTGAQSIIENVPPPSQQAFFPTPSGEQPTIETVTTPAVTLNAANVVTGAAPQQNTGLGDAETLGGSPANVANAVINVASANIASDRGSELPATPATSDRGSELPAQQIGAEANAALTDAAAQAASTIASGAQAVQAGGQTAGAALGSVPIFGGWKQYVGQPANLPSKVPPLRWADFVDGVNLANYVSPLTPAPITGFAKGTPSVPKTGAYLVGEEGPEIVKLKKGSQVIPNHKIGESGPVLGAFATGTTGNFTEDSITQARIDVAQAKIELDKESAAALGRGIGSTTTTTAPTTPASAPTDRGSELPKPIDPNIANQVVATKNTLQATASLNNSLTDAASIIESINAANEATAQNIGDVSQFLQGVPGLFGASPVTQAQLDGAAVGIPQKFADDFVRQLAAEIQNGNQEFGNLLPQAVAALEKIGVTPAGSPQAVLEQIKTTFASGQLFSNAENLSLINQTAVQDSIAKQQAEKQGQDNISAFFGALLGGDAAAVLGGGGSSERSNSRSGSMGSQADVVPFPGWTGEEGIIPPFPQWVGEGLIPSFPGWKKPSGFIPMVDWADFIPELAGFGGGGAGTGTGTSSASKAAEAAADATANALANPQDPNPTTDTTTNTTTTNTTTTEEKSIQIEPRSTSVEPRSTTVEPRSTTIDQLNVREIVVNSDRSLSQQRSTTSNIANVLVDLNTTQSEIFDITQSSAYQQRNQLDTLINRTAITTTIGSESDQTLTQARLVSAATEAATRAVIAPTGLSVSAASARAQSASSDGSSVPTRQQLYDQYASIFGSQALQQALDKGTNLAQLSIAITAALRNPQDAAPDEKSAFRAARNAGIAATQANQTTQSSVTSLADITQESALQQQRAVLNSILLSTRYAQEIAQAVSSGQPSDSSGNNNSDGTIIGGPLIPKLTPKLMGFDAIKSEPIQVQPAEQRTMNQPQTHVIYGGAKREAVVNNTVKNYNLTTQTKQETRSVIAEFRAMQQLQAV